jgi:peptide/nickel transport system substrate-binding protein
MISRRRFVQYALGASSLWLLAGCAPSAPSAPAAAPKPTEAPKPAEAAKPTAAAAAPTTVPAQPAAKPPEAAPSQAPAAAVKRGGTLTMVQGVDVASFDPTANASGNEPYFHQLYDSLVRIGKDGKPIPALAESWTWSEDGLTLTWKLRAGAKFHTGREVNAEDVKFAVERYKDEAVAANLRPKALLITEVQTPDAQTAVFKLKERYPGIFDMLDQFYIQNKDGVADIKTKPIGSGPFLLEEWKPGESFRMKRNPDYWMKDVPYLDTIVVQVVKDTEAQAAMLESGKADVVKRLPGTAVRRFEGKPDVQIIRAAPGASTSYVMMNVTKEPFTNKKVRQAIAYAIDRQRIARTAYPGGEGEVACLAWPGTHWANDAALAGSCAFDLDKAKALLAEAGLANGFKTTINAAVAEYAPGSKEAAQILQEDLKKIGVEMEITVYEAAEARKKIFDSDFDMLMHQYSAASADPSFNFPGRTFGPGKDSFSKFDSPELAKLVSDAGSEMDLDKRKARYADLEKYILDESYAVPTVFRYILFGARKRVVGFDADLSGYPDLAKTSVEG